MGLYGIILDYMRWYEIVITTERSSMPWFSMDYHGLVCWGNTEPIKQFFFLAIAGILVARFVCDLKMDPMPMVEGCGRNPHSWRDMHWHKWYRKAWYSSSVYTTLNCQIYLYNYLCHFETYCQDLSSFQDGLWLPPGLLFWNQTLLIGHLRWLYVQKSHHTTWES